MQIDLDVLTEPVDGVDGTLEDSQEREGHPVLYCRVSIAMKFGVIPIGLSFLPEIRKWGIRTVNH
jgi:hypothetical protein